MKISLNAEKREYEMENRQKKKRKGKERKKKRKKKDQARRSPIQIISAVENQKKNRGGESIK